MFIVFTVLRETTEIRRLCCRYGWF